MADTEFILHQVGHITKTYKVDLYYTGEAWITSRGKAKRYSQKGLDFILPIFSECGIRGVNVIRT